MKVGGVDWVVGLSGLVQDLDVGRLDGGAWDDLGHICYFVEGNGL